jgi:hypothetical protein
MKKFRVTANFLLVRLRLFMYKKRKSFFVEIWFLLQCGTSTCPPPTEWRTTTASGWQFHQTPFGQKNFGQIFILEIWTKSFRTNFYPWILDEKFSNTFLYIL